MVGDTCDYEKLMHQTCNWKIPTKKKEKQITQVQVTVKKKTNQTVNVSYSVTTPKTNQSLLPYSLMYIKQPVTNEYNFKLTAHIPQDYTVKEANNASLEKDTVNILQKITGDQEYQIKFIKR